MVHLQDFSIHKWENRLILIFTEDHDNALYQKQIKELMENEEGLLERKILVYHILHERHKVGLKTLDKWKRC